MEAWLFVALGSIGDALPLVHVAKEAEVYHPDDGGGKEQATAEIKKFREVVVLVSKGIPKTLGYLTQINGLNIVEDRYGPLLSAEEQTENVEQEGLQTILQLIADYSISGVVVNFFSAFAFHAAESNGCNFAIFSPSIPPHNAVRSSRNRIRKLVQQFPGWARCIEGSECTLDQVSYWMGHVLSQRYLEFRKRQALPSLPFWGRKFPTIPILLGMSRSMCPSTEIPHGVYFTGQCTVMPNKQCGSDEVRRILHKIGTYCKNDLFRLVVTLGSMESLSVFQTAGSEWLDTLVDLSSSMPTNGVLLHQTEGDPGLYRGFLDGKNLLFKSSMETDSDSSLTPTSLWLLTGPVPQLNIFQHGLVVLHHGGAGSVVTTIMSRKPQIVYPVAYDQEQWGEFVEQTGLGEVLACGSLHEVRRSLAHVLSRISHNYSFYRDNTDALAHEVLTAQSGARMAVESIHRAWLYA
eukprot:gb/GECG01011900.1/.p1 GENE.gb/GECG01011900.1/~~gb/GECG01011900.1/.p1  ORF type:complete len:463 (+),score=39.23 gb/GECG01011900.1/:1-1389(+)